MLKLCNFVELYFYPHSFSTNHSQTWQLYDFLALFLVVLTNFNNWNCVNGQKKPYSQIFYICPTVALLRGFHTVSTVISQIIITWYFNNDFIIIADWNTVLKYYSINPPGRLLNFVGPWEWALIQGWALIKFSAYFSASVVCLFCNKRINL